MTVPSVRNFADFAGSSSLGAWQVCVGDANFQDTGSLHGAALTFSFG